MNALPINIVGTISTPGFEDELLAELSILLLFLSVYISIITHKKSH